MVLLLDLFLLFIIKHIISIDLSLPNGIYKIIPYRNEIFLLSTSSQTKLLESTVGYQSSTLTFTIANILTNETFTLQSIPILSTFPSIALSSQTKMLYLFDINNYNDSYKYTDQASYLQSADITIIKITEGPDGSFSSSIYKTLNIPILAKLSEKFPPSIIPFSNGFFNLIYTNQQLNFLVYYIYDGTLTAYPQDIDYYIKSDIKCVLLSKATSNIICGTCYSYYCEIDVYDNASNKLASKLITSDAELYGVNFESEEDDKIIMTYYKFQEEEEKKKYTMRYVLITYEPGRVDSQNNDLSIEATVKNPKLECSYKENLKYYYQSTIMIINENCFLLGCYDEDNKKYKMRIFDHKDKSIASSEKSMSSYQQKFINYGFEHKYAIIYSDTNNKNIKVDFISLYECKDVFIIEGKNNETEFTLKNEVSSEFEQYEQPEIIFIDVDSGITIKKDSTPIELNIEYDKGTKYNFKISTAGTYTVKYVTGLLDKIVSNECIITIKIKDCHPNCYKCTNETYDNDNMECIECNSGYFPVEGKTNYCTSDIDEGYYFDKISNIIKKCNTKCKHCNENNHIPFIDQCTECIDGYYFKEGEYLQNKNCYQPSEATNYYLDPITEILKKCYYTCKTCLGEGTSQFHNCATCPSGKVYYQGNCYDSCPDDLIKQSDNTCYKCGQYLYPNKNDNKCMNCKTDFIPERYYYQGTCLTTKPTNTYIKVSTHNVIDYCYETCKTCNILGTSSSNQCLQCIDNYYTLSDSPGNCVRRCPAAYFADTINHICNICHYTCMTCEEGGTVQDNKCTVCKKGYAQNSIDIGQCYRDCNGEYWELPSENDNYTCIASCDDSSDNKILVEETNQCVKDCRNDPLCFYCQGKSLLNYNNKCVDECPSNSVADENYVCVELSIPDSPSGGDEDDEEKEQIKIQLTLVRYIETIKTFVSAYKDNKASSNVHPYYMKVKGIDFTSIIYNEKEINDIERYDESFKREGLIYTDKCQEQFQSFDEIITIQVTLEREGELTPQIEYALSDANGNLLDMYQCKEINVTVYSPVTRISLIPSYSEYKKYINSKYHINIYNSHDMFFNDICYEYHKDITIKDRQSLIYKNISLCETNCQFDSIEDNINMIKCICSPKTKISSTIHENVNIDSFDNTSNSLYDSRKCKRRVFNDGFFKGFFTNIGTTLYGISGLTYIGYLLFLLCKGTLYNFPILQANIENLPSSPPINRVSEPSINVNVNLRRKTSQAVEIEKFLLRRKTIAANQIENNRILNDGYRKPSKRTSRNSMMVGSSSSRMGMSSTNVKEDNIERNEKDITPHSSHSRVTIYSKTSLYNSQNQFTETTYEKEMGQSQNDECRVYVTEEERIINSSFDIIRAFYQSQSDSFFRLYLHYIKTHQSLLYLIVHQSFIEPFSLRFILFIFEFIFIFSINTLFFISSWYVSYIYKHKSDTEGDFFFVFTKDWIRLSISICFTLILWRLIRYTVSPHKAIIELFENERSISILREMLSRIKFRYNIKILVLNLITLFMLFFFGYLTTILFDVLRNSDTIYFYGCLIEIIFIYLIPLIFGLCSARGVLLSIKYNNKCMFNMFKP